MGVQNIANDDAELEPDITVIDEPDPADVAVITDGLIAYDISQTGYNDFRPLAVFVRDPATGKVVGGLHGRSEFGLRLCRLVVSAGGFASRTDRQPRIGDGRRRGPAARLHTHRAHNAERRSTRLLQEAGIRCSRDDRLRTARPHALLHDEEALTHGRASPARRAFEGCCDHDRFHAAAIARSKREPFTHFWPPYQLARIVDVRFHHHACRLKSGAGP